MTKWAIELSEFNIKYIPRIAQKGQMFANFLVNCYVPTPITKTPWEDLIQEIHIDGASNFSRVALGIILESSVDLHIKCTIHLDFSASNNGAEYEELVTGLGLAKKLRILCLQVYSNSELSVELSNIQYAAKDKWMYKYRILVRDLARILKQTR